MGDPWQVQDSVAKEAIYNYFRYLRAIGRMDVRVDEVARALGLPRDQVKRLASKLGLLSE